MKKLIRTAAFCIALLWTGESFASGALVAAEGSNYTLQGEAGSTSFRYQVSCVGEEGVPGEVCLIHLDGGEGPYLRFAYGKVFSMDKSGQLRTVSNGETDDTSQNSKDWTLDLGAAGTSESIHIKYVQGELSECFGLNVITDINVDVD